ncbi:hypothetical protein C8R46DRAFT_1035495 [Mycena filopes]|nr:hypothetical protein C8R46DRAFT_1035495 [Mycena filopes]
MPSLKGTLMNITSYRLGYTLQRPYPWRWATPAILGVFLLISVFLALVNRIHLSPERLIASTPLQRAAAWVTSKPRGYFCTAHPNGWREPCGEQLDVKLHYHRCLLWDENSAPVSSFSYYNNPFLDGCDIVNVMCFIPTRFQMTSTIIQFDAIAAASPPREILTDLWSDLGTSMLSAAGVAGGIPMVLYHVQGGFSTLIFDSQEWDHFSQPGDSFNTVYRFLILPGMNNAFQNVFQSLYHLARLELGITYSITENQIFNSPAMFNESISASGFPMLPLVAANKSRTSTSNATLMKEWADIVHMFNTTDRVPVISYLRPVPHLKPLGSALTSVFVSTFAMVSVLWTIFSLIAGIIATRSESPSTERTALSQLAECLNTHGVAIARMELALKKQGLFEDDDEEGDLESSTAHTSNQEENAGLLVHRTQADSYSVV